MKKIFQEKDLLILQELLVDGRKTASQISKSIDLGKETVNYHIKKLIKDNLIVKFVPKLSDKEFSEYTVLLQFNLDDAASKDQFIRQTIGDKYLFWLLKTNKSWDAVFRIYARSLEDFKRQLNDLLHLFNTYVSNYYTIVCSEKFKQEEKKQLLNALSLQPSPSHHQDIKTKTKGNVELDEKDIQIIEMLMKDARIQYTQIADHLLTSADTVKYRLNKLKTKGVVESIYPVLNYSKLGLLSFAHIVTLKNETYAKQQRLIPFLKESPFVLQGVKNISSPEFFFTTLFKAQEEHNTFLQHLYTIIDPSEHSNFSISQ